MLTPWKNNKKGISIIEILIVIAIIVIAFASLLGVATFSLRVSTLIKETNQANVLAQETIEVVRNFRDGTDWNINGLGTLTVENTYHLEKTADIPPQWNLVLGEETINGFVRKVIFSDVQRDANDNIVETGGTNDPNTKKVTATVSWRDKKVEIVTYLTNWR
ncbi:prepilin-type N-terminal cleavage/methylation domain-containing protein [Patescibacteria group bacterium]|nr:prepilin-type N-terminal cleavage/methylation domain-containing protein [Patescibacteria group bacterium]